MGSEEGVFSIMGNTFSYWAAFQESRNQPLLGLRVTYLSYRPFVEFAASVESPVVREFAEYLPEHSKFSVSNIDGDPQPSSLWLGHWTLFVVKESSVQHLVDVPHSPSRSEKQLRRILNGELPPKRQPRR